MKVNANSIDTIEQSGIFRKRRGARWVREEQEEKIKRGIIGNAMINYIEGIREQLRQWNFQKQFSGSIGI